MDANILKQLYEKYYTEIYLYLFSLCRQKEQAEDLVQETFIKALLSLSESHTNMRAWLYLVARNLYFDCRKRESRTVVTDFEENVNQASENPEPPDRMIMNEKKRLLYQAIQNLSQQKKEVLVLQYFGGLSQKEIAALLRLNPENVRVLAYRGKKDLKRFMEENGYEI